MNFRNLGLVDPKHDGIRNAGKVHRGWDLFGLQRPVLAPLGEGLI